MNAALIRLGFVSLCLSSMPVLAQYTNRSSVLDRAGSESSGGGYTNQGAGGQPGGIQESTGGSLVNQAGFLQTFILKPGLDPMARGNSTAGRRTQAPIPTTSTAC